MAHHKVDITLLGQKISIRTDDAPEEVLLAAQTVQEQIDELRAAGMTASSDRLLSLVALNLAGQLLRKDESGHANLEHIISSLDSVVQQAEGLAKVPLR
ncbi:MAG: cell division protein ZapA [Mariprofundaceae bacterium]|nr:cell division protein ZapA [Mariprofundaceae bacterium]